MRSDAARVISRSVMASDSVARSRPAYSPSLFSRTISMSMPGRELGTGWLSTGRRLAYRFSSRRNATMGLR